MGNLMGARAQMWTGELTYHGQGKRGQIIVRTEAIQASNEVLKIRTRVYHPNNVGGGCMGMCSERAYYECEIQREVPGTNNFVCAAKVPGQFNLADVNMPEQCVPLAQLCNADKSARIKLALVGRSGQRFNEAITTVNDLMQGRTTLQAGNNTTVVVDQFQVFVRPTFVDYLRSGWAVSLVAAIDYTASNGEPSNPSSLHYRGANN